MGGMVAQVESTGHADGARGSQAAARSEPTAGRVHVERQGGTAVVWLDNPARRNALGRAMLTDLFATLRELDADPETSCIVVRGTGGTFCSGLDLTSLGSDAGAASSRGMSSASTSSKNTSSGSAASDAVVAASGDAEHRMLELAEELDRVFAGLRTLSIAVVEGYAIGAGCQVALGCTIRLAAPGSCFAIPVGRLGLVYPPTSIRRLVELVGAARATLMVATGRRIDARTACAWGLATDLVGEHDGVTVDAGLQAVLAEVAAGSRLSLEASLAMVRAVAQDPRADGDTPEDLHHRWSALSEATGEHAEALRARAEKRPPAFGWRPGS